MRYLIIVFVLLTNQNYSQNITIADNYKFRFIKSKIGNQNNYVYSVKSSKNNIDKFQIRLKMQTLSNEREAFDPNKFYLVIDEKKIRVRPIDVRYNYGVGMIYVGFGYLANRLPKSDYVPSYIISQDSSVTDTFYNYNIEGYQNVSPGINFGTKKNQDIIYPYFKKQTLRSCKMDIYFSLPKGIKQAKFFYCTTLLKDLPIQNKTRG